MHTLCIAHSVYAQSVYYTVCMPTVKMHTVCLHTMYCTQSVSEHARCQYIKCVRFSPVIVRKSGIQDPGPFSTKISKFQAKLGNFRQNSSLILGNFPLYILPKKTGRKNSFSNYANVFSKKSGPKLLDILFSFTLNNIGLCDI